MSEISNTTCPPALERFIFASPSAEAQRDESRRLRALAELLSHLAGATELG